MAGRGTLIVRASLCVALSAGFWALGLAVVSALAGIPVAQSLYAGGPDLAGLAAGVAAAAVAWSLRPRWTLRWRRPPGPAPLAPEEAPGLHALVAEIAHRTGVRPPHELRLSARANASIGVERHRLGLTRTRVMELGLPLFALLERNELASVIAHELGHERGGDVVLGAWVHRTRSAIAGAVSDLEGSAFFLDAPFRAYGALFLRASGAVSRAQELSADACAAAACGPGAAWGALRKIEALGPCWDVYFHHDAVPAIERGARVPLFDGFRRFLAAERRRPEVTRALADAAEAEPAPGDTHPLHAQRLAAIDPDHPPDAQAPSPTGCADLLGGDAAAEEAWYRRALREPLSVARWDEVAARAILPGLAADLAKTPLDPTRTDLSILPALVREAEATWGRVARGVNLLSPAARRRSGLQFLGAWLAVALHRRGFEPRARPGEELLLVRGMLEVEPALVVAALASGELDEAAYEAARAAWEAAPGTSLELSTA